MKRTTIGFGTGLIFLSASGWLGANLLGSAQAQTSDKPGVVGPHIWPPRPIPPRPLPPRPILDQELQLLTQSAKVDIRGGVAKTKLTQTFQNTTDRTIEGTYVLPLPEGAAVTGFAMTVNGKRVEAEILEGDKAREIYTGIVQKMRDPAILEFIDRNMIRAKIFPILPRAEQKVELEYSETLKPESGSFRYSIPLKLPTGGAARSTAVEINIDSPDGIRAVYSPTHDVEVKREGNKARISGEFGLNDSSTATSARRPKPKDGAARDFVLYYTADKQRIGVNLVTYKEPGEDSYFMLLAAPDPEISKQEVAAKDVVFVCDTSGSMGGAKIEQAKRALQTILGNLNPSDRFNIITFSSDTRNFRDSLTAANKANLDAAREWVDGIKAVGGTNINEALTESLKLMSAGRQATGAEARTQQIVFMTDGQPTVGETDINNILKNIRSANGTPDAKPATTTPESQVDVRARLFVFGVGYDVNTRLLDSLAEENKGSSDYVLPEEDIEQKVGSLYGKIAYPVLTNARLEWKGRSVYDVYPKQLPDLFRGGQVVVFGRIMDDTLSKRASAPPRASVELTGWSGGKEQRIVGSGDFRGDSGNDVLPRLWAMRKVGYLLDDARRSGRTVDNEVKDEIIKLSKKFGIVTPFTAGLITEDEQPSQLPRESRWANPAGPIATQDMAAIGGLFKSKNVSGRGAVAASKATTAMRETATLREDTKLDSVRYLEGKTFTLDNGVWIDNAYDVKNSPKLQVIKFASPEYFELLKVKSMAKWLSVGDRVVVTFLNRAVQIEP